MRQRETKNLRSALARRLALGAVILIGLMSVHGGSAAGNTYSVQECGVHNAGAPDAHVYPVPASPAYPPGIDCSVGSFGLGLAGNPSVNVGAKPLESNFWALEAPKGSVIVNLTGVEYRLWSSCNNVAYLHGVDDAGVDSIYKAGWTSPFGDCHWIDDPCARDFCPLSLNAPVALRMIALVMYCADSPLHGCKPYSGPGFAGLRNLNMTLDDQATPAPPALNGSIAQGGPRRGTESLVANVSDEGSGVESVRVLVNGGQLADATRLSCSTNGDGSASRFTPCPTASAVTLSVDTDQGPWREGSNAVKICATDYSGLVGCSETPVTVDNSCDDSVGTTIGSNLDAGLAKGNEQPKVNTTISSREGITVKGAVTTASGDPVGGANVCLYEQVARGAEQKVLADIVHTKSNGSFRSNIDPGPSREIYVDYRHSNLLLEKQLQLGATSSPRLTIEKKRIRNGRPMKFKGWIPGPYNGGRIVTMQAKVGKQWKTFMQATTDTAGEFTGRYRFKHSTVHRAKYRFRSVVKEQSGYPFAQGISNTAKVIVKG